MSPLVSTFAGASVRALGWASVSLGGNYWFGAVVDSSRLSSTGYFAGIDVDSSGNFYARHSLNTTSLLDQVVKISSTPALTLQKSVTSTGTNADISSIVADSAGGFVTASRFDNTNIYENLTRWTSAGAQSWSYNCGALSFRNVVVAASDSPTANIYFSAAPNTIAKFNSSGTLQWQRRSTSLSTSISGLGVDSSENVYLYTSSGTSQPTIMKWNTSGTLQWSRQGTGANTAPSSINTANLSSTDANGNTYFIMANATFAKIDASGTLAWSRVLTFTGGSVDIYAIYTDSIGDVYVGGRFGTAAPYSAFVAKYNASGTIQWQRSFKDTANPTFGMQITALKVRDNVVWATTPNRSGNTGLFPNIFKFPTTGSLTGTYTITGTSQTWVYAASSITDSAGSVAVTNPAFADAAGSVTFTSRTETIATTTTATLSTKAIP